MRRPVIVYTPQVLVQGQDFRRWASDDFTEEVSRINSKAARARIALDLVDRALAVAPASHRDPAGSEGADHAVRIRDAHAARAFRHPGVCSHAGSLG